MPIKKSAYKDLKKSSVRHLKNIAILSELKTLTKKYERLVKDKKADEAKALLTALISKISRAASKGVIHTNSASRRISRLMKKLSKSDKA